MTYWVIIYLRDGSEHSVTLEQARQILESEDQLVAITDGSGEWKGKSINKADIVRTDRDHEKEKQENRIAETHRLEEKTPDSHPSHISKHKPSFIERNKD